MTLIATAKTLGAARRRPYYAKYDEAPVFLRIGVMRAWMKAKFLEDWKQLQALGAQTENFEACFAAWTEAIFTEAENS